MITYHSHDDHDDDDIMSNSFQTTTFPPTISMETPLRKCDLLRCVDGDSGI